MDFGSMFGGPVQPGSFRSVLGALGAGVQDAYSDGRGNNLARYQHQMQLTEDAARKKKTAEAFMASLFGTPDVAPNFSGPSAPGASGIAAPAANYTPSYSGGMMDGNPMLAKLAPLLSGMDPQDAQSLALPLLMKQFETKPDYTMGRERRSGVDNSLLATAAPDPVRPEATPDIIQIAQARFPNDPKAQNDYLDRNSPANLRAITNINTGGGNGSNVQSVQPLTDGTLLIVNRDGTTKHVTMDGQVVTGARYDAGNRFNMAAANAGGAAAGAAAESWPATDNNFGIVARTIKAFQDENVKKQAPKAIGFGSILPTVPGLNSDFRSLQGQLKGGAFLDAFNSLRGGGAISEKEGDKAESARFRAINANTPAEFYRALAEFNTTVGGSHYAARQRAQRGAVVPQMGGGAPQQQAPQQQMAPPPQAAQTKVINGVSYHLVNGQWMQ